MSLSHSPEHSLDRLLKRAESGQQISYYQLLSVTTGANMGLFYLKRAESEQHISYYQLLSITISYYQLLQGRI